MLHALWGILGALAGAGLFLLIRHAAGGRR